MNFAEWSEKRKKETADAVSFDCICQVKVDTNKKA